MPYQTRFGSRRSTAANPPPKNRPLLHTREKTDKARTINGMS
jgi:hypothetical protein